MNADAALLHLMLMERLGTDKYKVYGVVGEGDFFYWGNSEIEESSGYVLTDDNRAYYFWLGWNKEAQKPDFLCWDTMRDEEAEWVKANVA